MLARWAPLAHVSLHQSASAKGWLLKITSRFDTCFFWSRRYHFRRPMIFGIYMLDFNFPKKEPGSQKNWWPLEIQSRTLQSNPSVLGGSFMPQRVEGFLPCNKIPCEFRDFMPPKERCFAPEGFYCVPNTFSPSWESKGSLTAEIRS